MMSVEPRSAPRIPSLDGLRAVSILMVLASHASGTRNAPFAIPLAELGVRIFFSISGYLITTLLLAELERAGDISLRRFYLRRTLRIFPAYYTYVCAILLAAAVGWVALWPGDALHAFTYTTNYHSHRAWWLGHSWSLAVEEQFYLIWPALLVLVGARRGLAVAAGFVLAAPALRLVDWYAMPSWHAMQGESFWTIGDSVALGCVLAMVRPRLAAITSWQAFQRSWWFWLVPICGVASYLLARRFNLLSLALLQTITGVCVIACIDWTIRSPAHPIGRALNCRPLAFVGALSYSLYLWQQPFLNRHSDSVVAIFPLNLAFTFLAALASYYLVEQPMLRLRGKIEARLFRAVDRREAVAPPSGSRVGTLGPEHGPLDPMRR
jgi:peptidoglycan/LPS O-acetylase OafA/YrhL